VVVSLVRRVLRGTAAGVALLCVLLALTAVASLALGAQRMSPGQVLGGLLAHDGSRDSVILWDLRLPRTVLGVAVGAALGLAGAVMQALTRNPLAEPGILGVNAGAALAVVTVIAVFGVDDALLYVWAAFAGAAGTAVLVHTVGFRGPAGGSPGRLVLAGAAANAVFGSLTSAVILLDPRAFNAFRFWQVGTLAGRGLGMFWQVAPFLLAGVVLALLLARPLNALDLGDEAGQGLGARPGLTRGLGALAVVLLCGAATAAVGPIAFVGLAVPYMVRVLVGPDQRRILPYSMLLAPVLLLGADIAGRLVAAPGEVETGIVTAFLGAPAFIWLVRRGRIPHL
jgi:iron complex transport system permease protein